MTLALQRKKPLGLIGLTSLLGLAACFNDTPYSSAYAHIGILEVHGPGTVTFESELWGTQVCTASDNNCVYTNERQARATLTVTATPDEGHRFVGWSGDVAGDENPLVLVADKDALFSASFR